MSVVACTDEPVIRRRREARTRRTLRSRLRYGRLGHSRVRDGGFRMADGPVAERGMLTAPEELWDAAVRQAEVIGPLAEKDTVGLADADEAAAMLPRWSAPSPQNAPP